MKIQPITNISKFKNQIRDTVLVSTAMSLPALTYAFVYNKINKNNNKKFVLK